MTNTTIHDFNATEMFNSFDKNCIHTYVGVILGVLLFLSEALPFIRAKSKCQEEPRASVVDELEVEEEKQEQKETLLQQGNGLLHTAVSFYLKMRK